MSQSSSNSSSDNTPDTTTTTNRVAALETQVSDINDKLSQLLSTLQQPSSAAAPTTTPEAPPAAADPGSAAEKFKISNLSFSLPAPSASAVSSVLSIRQAYAESGKLTLFNKPGHLAQFPSRRFVPEPEGLFRRIKDSDNRDGWEAEVLWNTGYNLEVSLAALHDLSKAISTSDLDAATESISVLHHFLVSGYERLQERLDFFADSLESGKSEAILLQKYLREDDHPFSSTLYRDTKKKFAELRSKAFAKALNEQKAGGGKKGGKDKDNK